MKDKVAKTDIYIKPDVSKFSVISFKDGEEIIKQGEIASENFKYQLQKLGDSLHFKLQKLKTQNDSLIIKRILLWK